MGSVEEVTQKTMLLGEILEKYPQLEKAAVARLFDELWARNHYSQATQPLLPGLIQQDLRHLGGFPDLRVEDRIKLVYDVSRGLRDIAGQTGRPLLIRVQENIVSLVGVATFVGYTVPFGRDARIDLVTVHLSPVASILETLWAFSNVQFTPFGFAPAIWSVEAIGAINAPQENPKSHLTHGPIYLNGGDNVNASVIQSFGDPAAATYNARLLIVGVEVDVGAGFEGFE